MRNVFYGLYDLIIADYGGFDVQYVMSVMLIYGLNTPIFLMPVMVLMILMLMMLMMVLTTVLSVMSMMISMTALSVVY